MTKAYCHGCLECRTDWGDDAWDFIGYAGSAICQRCQSVVEFMPDGQEAEDETEDMEQEEETQ